jgi:selenocysteine lyase/cysteine desulfurase
VYGWNNVRCPDFVAQETLVLRREAHRFEAGTHGLIGLMGLRAAAELLLEVGPEAIGTELLRKRTWVTRELQQRGFTVLGADTPPEQQGGMFSFFSATRDMAALHAQLVAAGVTASLRRDRSGQRYLRFSPHFYNTDAELQRALAAL